MGRKSQSTDVEGLCQLLVLVRYIWNSEPHEDMLLCEPISGSTREEIFNTVDAYIGTKGLDCHKCIGICTDGACAICGRNSRVVTRILELPTQRGFTAIFTGHHWYQNIYQMILERF